MVDNYFPLNNVGEKKSARKIAGRCKGWVSTTKMDAEWAPPFPVYAEDARAKEQQAV